MTLSFLLPYYKRGREFVDAFDHNFPIFGQPQTEVVIVMDSPDEKDDVLRVVRSSGVKSRVLMNTTPHAWRCPSKAINVALRHSEGEFVCILSPETHVDLPHPSFLMDWTVCGEMYSHSLHHNWLSGVMHYGRRFGEPFRVNHPEGFGMLMTAKENLTAIGGCDEIWAGCGEDDDLRNRLERNGVTRAVSEQIKLSHYASYDSISQGGHVPRTKDHYRGGDNEPIVKNDGHWGKDFSDVIYDWRTA